MRKKLTRFSILVLLISGLLLSGCGGAAAENYSSPGDIGIEEPSAESGNHNEALKAVQKRIVLMTGSMTVETEDPERILSFITKLAERYAGYVVESNLEQSTWTAGQKYSQGSIKIRIPSESLNTAIAEIKAQNLTVINENIEGEDVTAQYVDLKSRLRNLESAAERLESIMENATETEAVLKVYKELVSVNEEAEVVRGQIQYYDEAAAMSSLAVRIEQVLAETEPETWKFGPTFQNATDRLSSSFEGWLKGSINLIIYSLPMFILRAGPWLALFYFVGRWIFRKYRKNKPALKTNHDLTEIDS